MPKLKQEIFAAGKWNGFEFTLNDLRKMKASFDALKNNLKVPLKLGHNDEQPVLDGQPALGWVEGLFVDDTQKPPKLVAEFDHVPDVMMSAFEKKLYRSVSIELDFDVTHKGRFYDFVITAVALLGADMPAVNVLSDLGALMSRNSKWLPSDFSVGDQMSFSSISGNHQEKSTMTEQEEAKLRQELAEAKAAKAELSANFSKLETQVEDLTKRAADAEDARKKAERQATVDTARSKFTAILEDAVKAEAITPAQRESYTKILGIDDDERVLTLKEDDVRGLFTMPGKQFGRDAGREMSRDGEDRQFATPGEELSAKAYKYMAGNPQVEFSRAVEIVMAGDPKLAKDYMVSNGEVTHASG